LGAAARKDAAAIKGASPAGPASMAPVRPHQAPHTPPEGDGAAAKPAPTAAAGHSQSILEDAIHFVSTVLPTIRRVADSVGVSPLGMLAQSALETGWGKRMPHTADGTPSLNMFGIKAGENWSGPRATASTVEFSGGVATQRHSAFRAYGSIEASVNDFANLLRASPRYRQAVAAGGDAQNYIHAIGESGYATDPQYANKLNEMMHSSIFRTALIVASTKL
jgi:flagellar protein FlgJ